IATFPTNVLAAGSHTITAVYSGDDTFAFSTSPPLTQVVNPPTVAPAVTVVGENNGAAQRSMVTRIAVTFSTVVTFAGPVAQAFTLTRLSDNATVNVMATPATAGGVTVVTLTGFSGAAASFGSLADGRYALKVTGSAVTANGVAMASDFTFADSRTSTGNQLF